MSPVQSADFSQTFQLEGLDVRGRLVRLGPALDQILDAHAYPQAVADMLAETLTLGAVLARALKYKGQFTLQVQGDGPISLLIVDVTSDGALRGSAQFDEARVAKAAKLPGAPAPRLLGAGHLAFTVDQGQNMGRYQGITALEGPTLADCAQAYFRTSEQLETAIFMATRSMAPARSGAVMVQRMPAQIVTDEADAEEGWRRAVALLASLTADEVLDPALDSDRLLYRLYHEDGVRTYPPHRLEHRCRCSQDKVATTLKSFPRAEIIGDDGHALVVCEFCKASYDFPPADLDTLYR